MSFLFLRSVGRSLRSVPPVGRSVGPSGRSVGRSAGRSPLPPLSSRTVDRSVGPPPLPTRRPMPETRKPGDPGDPRTRRFSQKCAQARDVHWGKPFFLTPAECFVGMGEKDKPCFFFVFSSRCRPASRTAKSSLITPPPADRAPMKPMLLNLCPSIHNHSRRF